jgi:SAM-dependent methyltransferase
VDAIDASAAMIDRARSGSTPANVRWLAGDLLDPGLPRADGGYEVVTALSSLHHMPLRAGLARLADLVADGGLLVVVGLYRPVTPADYAVGLIALPANWIAGTWLALRGRAGQPDGANMPVKAAQATLAEIREAAAELLPACRLRRHLFWRYGLVWHRPRPAELWLRSVHD